MTLFSLFFYFYFYVLIKPDTANATELITRHSYKPENMIIVDWLSENLKQNNQKTHPKPTNQSTNLQQQ